ncbi:MAG: permease [Planctomycetota bacterium]
MSGAVEAVFWGGLLRFAQATLAAAPTLLVGLVVAGVFRKLLGPDATRKAFGGDSWRSLPQAWLWGMLLPVCSLGVIPVAYELRRSGLSGGTILAFCLTAPLFNPLSLLYGLTLSSPTVLMAFAFASLLVVTVVGFTWDRLFPHTAQPPCEEPAVPPGLGRILSVGMASARHAAGPTLLYCLIGLSGSMLLTVIFPHGSLTDSMAHTDRTAPLQMLRVAIPAYATPLNVMMQVGGMFVHGNSVGAAYVLLALGAGANLGLIAWAWRTYGFGRAATFLSLLIAVVMVIAYAVEDPLYSAGSVEHPHTHAFDVYACPFRAGSRNLADRARRLLADDMPMYELISLAAVATFVASGLGLRRFDPEGQIEASLASRAQPAEDAPKSVLNAEVPGPVLGGVAIAGLVALSIVGCFIFYPAPEETLEEMRYVRADLWSYAASKDVENTGRCIQRYDDLTRRLQVGYYLRTLTLTEFQQSKARVLRGRLEQLKDVVEAGEFDRVRELNTRVSDAHQRVREAFEGNE